MTTANDYNDIIIRHGTIGDRFLFPDDSISEIIFKSEDGILPENYTLTQIQLVNVKKDGATGKLTTWLKFRN